MRIFRKAPGSDGRGTDHRGDARRDDRRARAGTARPEGASTGRSGTSARARRARARPVRSPSGKTAVRTVRPERRARPRAEGRADRAKKASVGWPHNCRWPDLFLGLAVVRRKPAVPLRTGGPDRGSAHRRGDRPPPDRRDNRCAADLRTGECRRFGLGQMRDRRGTSVRQRSHPHHCARHRAARSDPRATSGSVPRRTSVPESATSRRRPRRSCPPGPRHWCPRRLLVR